MSKQEPWEMYPEVWDTKSKFFTYIRGNMRKTWMRYPAKIIWKNTKLVIPPHGYTGRAKKLGQCEYCANWFAASHLEVDHIDQAGSCNSWDDFTQFVKKLLDCNNNWRLSCKPCHKIKSLAERKGVSMEEAALLKDVIATINDNSIKDVTRFIEDYDYNQVYKTSNASGRKKSVEAIYRLYSKEE